MRVEQAARGLGYVANAMARGLVSGRTRTLGMVLRDTVSPLYAQIRAVIERRALQADYRVLTTSGVGLVENEKAALAALISMRVEGLVVCSGLLPACDIAEFAPRVPTVVVGRPEFHPSLTSVYCDENDGGAQIADHVADHGHRCVAVLVVPRLDALTQNDRSLAMAARLRARCVRVVEVEAPFERDANDIVDELIGIPHSTGRPTAVMCPTDSRAVEIAGVLLERGLSVPDDISVSGFDGMPPFDSPWIGLTTFRQPIEAIAHKAIDLLLRKIDDPVTHIEHVGFTGQVLSGHSVRTFRTP